MDAGVAREPREANEGFAQLGVGVPLATEGTLSPRAGPSSREGWAGLLRPPWVGAAFSPGGAQGARAPAELAQGQEDGKGPRAALGVE